MEDSSKSNSSSKTDSTGGIVYDFSNRPALDLDPSTSDWQGKMCTLSESFEYILSKNFFSDVTFIVGEDNEVQKMSANKMVLSARSSVFYTMFGETWSSNCNEIEVPDADPSAFSMMLKFLYSDKILLTLETVPEVIYVAKKYLITVLEKKCIEFLLNTLSSENAFTILILARLFNLKRLVKGSLKVIADYTLDTLQTKDFFNIDVDTLCLVLKRSDLMIDELPLFQAVIRWSEAACQKQELPINPENQRLVLKAAPLLLRFPLMDFEDFASEVVASGILTEKETISAFLHFTQNSKPSVFSEVDRNPFFVANRYQSEVTNGGPFRNSNGCDSTTHRLMFTVNRAIYLFGIGLYGSPDVSKAYEVHVNLYIHNTGAGVGQMSETFEGSKKIFRVMFKQPITLSVSVQYRINVTIKGEYYLYGYNGSQNISFTNSQQNRRVNFQFYDYDGINYETDRGRITTVNSGQIPEFLFRF